MALQLLVPLRGKAGSGSTTCEDGGPRQEAAKVMSLRALLMVIAVLGAGCVTLTPEQKLAHQIFVETAYRCESRYHTIHVDQIDLEGGLQVHADADSRGEYRAFVACYHEGLQAQADGDGYAGKPSEASHEPIVHGRRRDDAPHR